MEKDIIRLIKEIYKGWKKEQAVAGHLDEEDMVCFIQNLASDEEKKRIMGHIGACRDCADALALCLKAENAPLVPVPPELIERLVAGDELAGRQWQIKLRLGEKIIEIINTAGDVLVGQELVPMPVLRSRSIKEFKDEVMIFKEFKDIRVEARIVNKQGKSFDLTISGKNKQNNQPIRDLRVSLFRDDLELESYLADAAGVTFEHIALGKYTVELRDDIKFASIILDIKT